MIGVLKVFKKPIIYVYLISIMVAHNGYLIIYPVVQKILKIIPNTIYDFHSWSDALSFLEIIDIPEFIVGFSLFFMSFMLTIRNRIAWFISISLLFFMVLFNLIMKNGNELNNIYEVISILFLATFWRQFYRYSIGGISILSSFSILSLIVYGTLGVLYLGSQFNPKIEDLYSAFYFVIVCMSTVGFGDIVPCTPTSRLFTVTLIIFGITIFTASVASIAGTLIRHNVHRILTGGFSYVVRNNHYIIAGSSSLAQSVSKNLADGGAVVTVVCYPDHKKLFPDYMDVVEGDPSAIDTLKQAGADKAKYIISLMDNDADNAFVILTSREISGEKTKTISLVNESQNMNKIKHVHPDGVLSLQQLGSEILVRALKGEKIDDHVIDIFFVNPVKK